MDYCEFLMSQGLITRTRRTFDRALRALPITQHHRIWPLYLKFVRMHDLKETAVRVYRRFLKVTTFRLEQKIIKLHAHLTNSENKCLCDKSFIEYRYRINHPD